MKAWAIFRHSVMMVLRNFKEVLQIGLVPMLISFAAVLGVLMTSGLSFDMFSDELAVQRYMETAGLGGFFLRFMLVWLIAMLTMFWVVVSWHRFVLLEEYPTGWLPPFRFGRILSYLGHFILLGLIAAAVLVPFMFLVAANGRISMIMLVVVVLPFFVFLSIAMYRLVLILPAAAIGKPLKLSQAWQATIYSSGTIFLVLVIGFAFQFLMQLAFSALVLVPFVGQVAVIFFSSLIMMINISLLTTLYGHYVEGREIT